MLFVSDDALRPGCERAPDLFRLNPLRGADGADGFTAVFEALRPDRDRRDRLERALLDLVPVEGAPPLVQAGLAGSMLGGVLVGLLIADSALADEELDLPVTEAGP